VTFYWIIINSRHFTRCTEFKYNYKRKNICREILNVHTSNQSDFPILIWSNQDTDWNSQYTNKHQNEGEREYIWLKGCMEKTCFNSKIALWKFYHQWKSSPLTFRFNTTVAISQNACGMISAFFKCFFSR